MLRMLKTHVSLMLSVALCASMLALSACNTVEGAGEDVKAAGKAISNGAKKTKEKISN